jgi:hypothetical protein
LAAQVWLLAAGNFASHQGEREASQFQEHRHDLDPANLGKRNAARLLANDTMNGLQWRTRSQLTNTDDWIAQGDGEKSHRLRPMKPTISNYDGSVSQCGQAVCLGAPPGRAPSKAAPKFAEKADEMTSSVAAAVEK